MTERNFVDPPKGRLVVRRGGQSITRQVPKPVVIVDTREQNPFTFEEFPNWIGGTLLQGLPTGDYSIAGMESLLALERKSLSDLIVSLIQHRRRFLAECERLAHFPYRAILVEATYEDLNAPYHEYTSAHPNGVTGTLDAIEAKFLIPVIYTSTDRRLSERKAAAWLSKYFTYWWLEQNGLGRVLQEGDL